MAEQEINYDNVINLLIQGVPELQPLLNEHLNDQFGQLLPHLFFGDLTRYVMEQMRKSQIESQRQPPEVVRRIIGILEKAMLSSDMQAKELVQASFLENLDATDSAYSQLKSAMSPNLRRELDHFEK
jgi:hypothetical protein